MALAAAKEKPGLLSSVANTPYTGSVCGPPAPRFLLVELGTIEHDGYHLPRDA